MARPMLSLLCVLAGFFAAPALGSEVQLNPITRVVELLEGLAKKVEADGKAEEDLFEKFVCWYKTVVSTKTASNAKAKDQIETLVAYIDDVESGRIEFTSERADLEKRIGELNSELETAKDLRDKEHEDFLAAKDEMEKAIAALEKAIDVLAEGTGGGGDLLSTAFDVKKVVALGRSMGMMNEKDARFLERALDAQIPSIDGKGKDWKKLNRKATFKMKYKARSGNIQNILADMLQTFQDNLAEAERKEEEALATYEKLKGAKEDEKKAAQDALTDSEKEGGARALSLQESQDELESLRTQVENDEKYIAETEEAYQAKLKEWKVRKSTRADEIAAINKAIAVLRSDDARDTFKKSMSSQGYLFLQEGAEVQCSPAHRQRKAITLLRTVSRSTRSIPLATLATKISMSTGGAFDKVLTLIDDMLKTLEEEADADLKKKEECEKDRLEQTKKAKDLSQEIDEKSEFIERKQALIEELSKKIEEHKAEIADLEKQLQEATDQRNSEKTEYELNKADDEAAVELIGKAMGTLEEFYGAQGGAAASLVQKRKKQAPGEAPPPPPSTFEGEYGGAQGEANGIIAILEMIKADVEKDIAKADEEEKKSREEFDKFKADTEESISTLEAAIVDFEGQISDAENAVADSETQRADLKKLLEETLTLLKDMAPGCDFIAIHFEVRKKNRQAEKDGLEKAKAILKGASTGGFLQHGSSPC